MLRHDRPFFYLAIHEQFQNHFPPVGYHRTPRPAAQRRRRIRNPERIRRWSQRLAHPRNRRQLTRRQVPRPPVRLPRRRRRIQDRPRHERRVQTLPISRTHRLCAVHLARHYIQANQQRQLGPARPPRIPAKPGMEIREFRER